MKYLEFMFSGFWHFVGCMMLLGGIANGLFIFYNRTLRHWNIRKHGYPPANYDADGDFKTESKTDS